jgi:hypothetical protein
MRKFQLDLIDFSLQAYMPSYICPGTRRLLRCYYSLTAATRSAIPTRWLTLRMLQIAYYDINPAIIRCEDLGYAATSGPQNGICQLPVKCLEHCVPITISLLDFRIWIKLGHAGSSMCSATGWRGGLVWCHQYFA